MRTVYPAMLRPVGVALGLVLQLASSAPSPAQPLGEPRPPSAPAGTAVAGGADGAARSPATGRPPFLARSPDRPILWPAPPAERREETARGPGIPSPMSGAPAPAPLAFEINRGQGGPGIDFLARGRGYQLFLKATGATLVLRKSGGPTGAAVTPGARVAGFPVARRRPGAPPPTPELVTVHLCLVGSSPEATASGLDTLPGTVNYVVGRDPAGRLTGIPTYARVRYASVYPGVDLVYYGTGQRQLEYDFHVAPGADPTAIRLRFEGVDGLEVDAAGDLVLQTAAGPIRQRRPVVYQEVAGVRHPVAGRYVRGGEREVGFRLGHYDAARPLVIDPVITHSTYWGGDGDDTGHDIAVDAAGNIYLVGTTSSLGRYDTDVFVRKFNPDGSQLLYETYLDSNGTHDAGHGIAVDAGGQAYVTGQFGSPLLPGFALGVLVAKLGPTGVPLYQVTFGANSPGYSLDEGADVAVDDAGNAYVVGTTYGLGTPFPTTPGAFQESFGGGLTDAFVVKLDPAGGFVYSTLLGGAGDEEGFGIAIRKAGPAYHAYVTGKAALAGDFPTTPGAFQKVFGGAADAFVTRLDGSGSGLVYSTYLGGRGLDGGYGIAVDPMGHAYLTGIVSEDGGTENTFPVANAFQPTYGGSGGATPAGSNAFVTKLDPTGSALVYSSYLGGGGFALYDAGLAITADHAGYAYLTGVTATRPDLFTGHRFPIVNAFQPEPGGGASSYYPDAFVAKLTPQGALVYASYLGGSYWDEGYGIDVDGSGRAHVTGMTMSSDFPTTGDASQGAIGGGGCSYPWSCPDAFVTRISPGGGALAAPTLDIRANGSEGPVTTVRGAPLTVTIALDPGGSAGQPADWWVVAATPFGPHWYTLEWGWVRSDGPIPLYGGPLFSLSAFTVLEFSALPAGAYVFYFGCDTALNGVLDVDRLHHDGVEVHVMP